MTFNPERPPRRSIRLQEYDYTSEGLYFITICTYNRHCCFGEIRDGEMHLSDMGQVVSDEWQRTPLVRQNVELDAFIIMPNHLHGIIVINQRRGDPVGRPIDRPETESGRGIASPLQSTTNPLPQRPKGVPSGSLGAIIGQFKSSVSRRVKDIPEASFPLWQRNYYEHIIRNEDDLNRIRAYIENNPSTWETDAENPNLPRKNS